MTQDAGWALYTPGGIPIAATFDCTKEGAGVKAYDWLQSKSWAREDRFWKQWDAHRGDEFIAERTRRGWTIHRARLTYI